MLSLASLLLVSCDADDGSGARTGQVGGPNSESGKPGGPAMQSQEKEDHTPAPKSDASAAGSSAMPK